MAVALKIEDGEERTLPACLLLPSRYWTLHSRYCCVSLGNATSTTPMLAAFIRFITTTPSVCPTNARVAVPIARLPALGHPPELRRRLLPSRVPPQAAPCRASLWLGISLFCRLHVFKLGCAPLTGKKLPLSDIIPAESLWTFFQKHVLFLEFSLG
ncbi:hypothetical protein NL676_008754 [Syzygium grande]|nr:hypothetical protein NL676_008754 [Syzygium grande]